MIRQDPNKEIHSTNRKTTTTTTTTNTTNVTKKIIVTEVLSFEV
ncbi:Protein of unknown function [Bacillus mobilis]|nr:Protein of unknown function [Bacillus mobilis]